nr:MAG TPA: hypothetical protein [Caudoviricetes sp.]
MFAMSEKQNAGVALTPIFSRANPPVVTLEGTADSDIKQYQVVTYNMGDRKVKPVTSIGGVSTSNTVRLAVAAFPAKSGKGVTVYVEGFININVVDVSAITDMAGTATADKVNNLNTIAGISGIYFDDSVLVRDTTDL